MKRNKALVAELPNVVATHNAFRSIFLKKLYIQTDKKHISESCKEFIVSLNYVQGSKGITPFSELDRRVWARRLVVRLDEFRRFLFIRE